MIISDYTNYLIFFSGALVISLVVNLLMLKFSQNLGIRNKNDVTVRWSSTSKPSLGGISLFLGFLFSTFMYLILDPKSELFSNISYTNLITYSNSWEFSWRLIDSLNTHIDRIGQILHYRNNCVFYKKILI